MYHTSTPPVLSVQRLQTDLAALNATLLAVVGRSVRVGVCLCMDRGPPALCNAGSLSLIISFPAADNLSWPAPRSA
jgi:hypothetical protein